MNLKEFKSKYGTDTLVILLQDFADSSPSKKRADYIRQVAADVELLMNSNGLGPTEPPQPPN